MSRPTARAAARPATRLFVVLTVLALSIGPVAAGPVASLRPMG